MATTNYIVIANPDPNGPPSSLLCVNNQLAFSDTPLGDAGVFTSGVFANDNVGEAAVVVDTDQTGTLVLEGSDDGTHWFNVGSLDVTGGTIATQLFQLYGGLLRFVYTNGATPQTSFRFSAYSTGGGRQDV
jgi:hypothetical protein